MSLVSSPRTYAAWSFLVVATLGTTYFVDPYVFGIATLILAASSSVVGLAGLSAVLFSKTAPKSAKTSIIVAVLVAASAIIVSVAILRTFNWA